jgi:hypothetical protein
VIKTLKILGIAWNSLKLEGIYKNPWLTYLMLKNNAFPLRLKTRRGYLLSPPLLNIVRDVLPGKSVKEMSVVRDICSLLFTTASIRRPVTREEITI